MRIILIDNSKSMPIGDAHRDMREALKEITNKFRIESDDNLNMNWGD